MSKGKKQKRKYQVDAAKGMPSAETTKLPPAPHPMIESIVVRDVATYAHEGVTFDNLQLINFIYGSNGCGKTTLSRLLASTEPEKDYPNCQIHWTTKPIQTLVYNKDFRDRNLSENIPGVFTLGEQRVEAMQEKDRMRLEAETNGQMAERLARRMAECEDQKNGQWARLRDRLWQNVYRPNELFKDCLRGYITKGKFTDRLVELKYHRFGRPNRIRTVMPYQLKQYNNRWYLVGCEPEKLPRLKYAVVPIDRIDQLTVKNEILKVESTGTAEAIREHFTHIVGVSLNPESRPETVRLKVWKPDAWYIDTKPIHWSRRQELVKRAVRVTAPATATVPDRVAEAARRAATLAADSKGKTNDS